MCDQSPRAYPFTTVSEGHRRQLGEAIFSALARINGGETLPFALIIGQATPADFRPGVDRIELAVISNLTTAAEEVRMLRDAAAGIANTGEEDGDGKVSTGQAG